MLKSLLCASLEKAINLALAADAASTQRLQALEQRCIALQFKDIDVNLYWYFSNQKVHLYSDWRHHCDASIGGPFVSIAELSLRHASITKDLSVSGDLRLIEDFKTLFAELDIDWEQKLANYVGDAPAFRIGKALRSGAGWLKQAHTSLRENSKEYLQEEANLLPSKLRLNNFSKDVRQTQRDVERLQARLQKLRD